MLKPLRGRSTATRTAFGDNENFERTRDLALPRTQRIGESPHRRSSAGKRLGIEEDIEEEIDSDGLEKLARETHG